MNNKELVYTITLPLITEVWQEHKLNKIFSFCCEIQNELIKKIKRIIHYYSKTNEWKEIENEKDFKKKNKLLKDFIKNHNLPFTQFGINAFYKGFCERYKKYGINSTICECICSRVWVALEKFLYSKGKKLSYKEKDDFISFKVRKKGNSFYGLKLDLNKSTISINIDGKKKYLTIPFKINKKSDYEMFAFSNSNEIREIGIKRIFIRGKWKYFITFTIKGVKYEKNRQLGYGNVGIDLGPSTIAIASNNKVYIDELGKNVNANINKYEHDIQILLRKIDRSRRQNNPLQFNENGTIKKYPKGQRPKWNYSKNYIKLKNKLRELYRKKSVLLKLSHINLANQVINYGDKFIVENNPVNSWALKAKNTTTNKKGKINKKKRFGKSILNHAPSTFITILQNKINSLGGLFIKIPINVGASQFDFTNNKKTKHSLSERRITLSNGNTHLRDTIAAFNIQYYNSNKNNKFDVDEMKNNYSNFSNLEKLEINRHKGKKVLKSIGI